MTSRDLSNLKMYENEFIEFLIKRLGNAGGSLHIQHISGHLSQVRSEVRNVIGRSQSDLLKFLKRHRNLFNIEKNVVSLVQSSSFSSSGYESDNNSTRSQSNLPSVIRKGRGVIIKLNPNFGFIKSKEPIKTEIFFSSFCFGDKDIDLTGFLHVGAIVYFNAKLESPQKELNSKYRAIKVWRVENADDGSNVINQKSRKTRDTGLYDPMTLEDVGFIQNVFPNLGFISVKGNDRNTVFFHKNRVVNYDNIVDLTKVFEKGDKVEFTAHRSSKPDSKARWEAIKVWKVSGKIQKNILQPIASLKNKTPEMIKNQPGKIYPRSDGAVVKFGNDEIADGDSALYYICGCKVTDIGWEFSEGDEVHFDAVKIKSAPGWKAVLVWTDAKPDVVLPTCLGDFSEFTEDDDNIDISSSIYASKSSLCMSEGSNLSVKSENISSKTNNFTKEKTLKSSDYFSGKVKNNKLSKNYKASSRDSLNSLPHSDKYCFAGKETGGIDEKLSKNNTSSKDSLNSVKTVPTNWGDTPYPVDKACESMEVPKHFTEDEMEYSSEYASAEEERVDKNSEEKEKDSSLNSYVKCAASIKKYNNVKGEVHKVFSRFAEVKSDILPNCISFSMNDFYCNGMTIDELGLDDLKDILKVGASITFNCFVIVDDSGHPWQKITLAWNGVKPIYSEVISPENFIKQNDLCVTVNKVSDNETEDKIPQRKFLTSFKDETLDDDNTDNLSRTESCTEVDSLTLSPTTQVQSKDDLPESLSDAVCLILKRDVFSKDTVVDLKCVSQEIIAIVQNYTTNANTLSYVLPEEKCKETLENTCSKCKEKPSSLIRRSAETKETAVQTIITGDIISHNILPAY